MQQKITSSFHLPYNCGSAYLQCLTTLSVFGATANDLWPDKALVFDAQFDAEHPIKDINFARLIKNRKNANNAGNAADADPEEKPLSMIEKQNRNLLQKGYLVVRVPADFDGAWAIPPHVNEESYHKRPSSQLRTDNYNFTVAKGILQKILETDNAIFGFASSVSKAWDNMIRMGTAINLEPAQIKPYDIADMPTDFIELPFGYRVRLIDVHSSTGPMTLFRAEYIVPDAISKLARNLTWASIRLNASKIPGNKPTHALIDGTEYIASPGNPLPERKIPSNEITVRDVPNFLRLSSPKDNRGYFAIDPAAGRTPQDISNYVRRTPESDIVFGVGTTADAALYMAEISSLKRGMQLWRKRQPAIRVVSKGSPEQEPSGLYLFHTRKPAPQKKEPAPIENIGPRLFFYFRAGPNGSAARFDVAAKSAYVDCTDEFNKKIGGAPSDFTVMMYRISDTSPDRKKRASENGLPIEPKPGFLAVAFPPNQIAAQRMFGFAGTADGAIADLAAKFEIKRAENTRVFSGYALKRKTFILPDSRPILITKPVTEPQSLLGSIKIPDGFEIILYEIKYSESIYCATKRKKWHPGYMFYLRPKDAKPFINPDKELVGSGPEILDALAMLVKRCAELDIQIQK